MKFFPVIAIFFFIGVVSSALTEKARHALEKAEKECQADPNTRIDKTILEKFTKHEKVETTQIAKYALCLQLKLGIQKQNGDVNVDTLKSLLEMQVLITPEEIKKIVDTCGVPASGTREEAALALVNCVTSLRSHFYY